MVNELRKRGKTVYECELCGFGYSTIDTAEQCEEYCNTHGTSSPDITRKAIHKPQVRVMTAAA